MDFQLIATAASTLLAPFMPYLLKAGKDLGSKLVEFVSQKGGELVGKKAQEVWEKLERKLGDDPEVQAAATMISAQPENQQRQEMFAEILAARLQQDPDLAKELIDLMGGQEGIQQVIADRNSTIKDVSQDMKGSGKQTVQADNKSRIEGVKQVKQ